MGFVKVHPVRLRSFKLFTTHLVSGLILVLILALSSIAASIATFASASDDRHADAAIVLGAAVSDGVPSPVFEQRIVHAISLYQRGTVSRLILTGGVGEGDTVAESEAARDYCLARGIPASAILIETQSRTTRENLVNAKSLLAAHGVRRVLIVSDPLHERRAVTMARDLGLDAYPSPTPTTLYTGMPERGRFLAREVYFYAQYLIGRLWSFASLCVEV